MDTQNVPTSVINARILEHLDRDEVKKAQDAATDYTRTQIREESFAFKILPPEKATDDMLDRALDERLQIIWELEPEPPLKALPRKPAPEFCLPIAPITAAATIGSIFLMMLES